MTALQPICPRLARNRHLWGSLARDLVLTNLPQPNAETAVSLAGILDHYNLTGGDLRELIARLDFQALWAKELREAEALGRQAAHVLRTSALAADMAEVLYNRARDPETPLGEVIKAYAALAKSAGLDEVWRDKGDGGTTVNVGVGVNFAVPTLNNPKVAYLHDVSV